MRHAGKTPPFRAPQGEPLPGSIAEVSYLPLGGLDQWVLIRGESVANPPLLLLHGGPGMSETSFFRHCNAALEKGFTVVYWDQRGTGKSFYRKIPRSSMTVEQFITDLDELVEAVRTCVGDRLSPNGAALGIRWSVTEVPDWTHGEAILVSTSRMRGAPHTCQFSRVQSTRMK